MVYFPNNGRGDGLMKLRNNRRVTILKNLIIAVVMLLVLCPAAHAESEDDSGFSMGVPGVRSLTLEDNNIQFEPDTLQMLDGWTHQEVLIARVNANVDWVLTVRGSDEYWEGPWQKPVSDIYWKYGGLDYESMSTQNATVASGGPCNQNTYPIHFKVMLDLESDVPGDYYYEYVVFELSAP